MQDQRELIGQINIDEELKTSYIDYAMSVIVGRALPDARDGLKPVHRRILYAMYREGLLASKSHSKCAGVVGEVLKKYHPHGDSAVYDALVRLAQPWNMRHMLIDGQGNFGSVDGDSAAAYRYTEARLAPLGELMLQDIDRDTVGFQDNFDGKAQEPLVLPAAFPMLLVNGSAGIAVGMATNIPPHNLGEVIDALALLIDNPRASLQEIMRKMPGPDFPTGGYIQGRDGILEAYKTGRGRVVMRAKCHTEQLRGGNKEAIIVTELPYQVNKSRMIENLAELVRDKKITGITDLRDESNRQGIRVVIELRKGEVPEVVINNLYKHTEMQSTFGAIMLALVDGRPRYLSLPKMLQIFIDHRCDVVVRRTRYELRRALKRLHLVHGLFTVLDNVDAVIKIIRGSASTEEARDQLMARFKVTTSMAQELDPGATEPVPLSREQAQAILDMRLARLTALERDKLLEERKELVGDIEKYRGWLASPAEILRIVKAELLEVKAKHADPRRSEIVASSEDLTIEDLIAEENMVVTISHQGYIKRTATSQFRRQRRGGKGTAGMATKDEDWVEHLFVGTTHSYILFFTDRGKAYWLKVYELPEGSRATKGRPVVNMLELEPGEKIMALIPVREFDPNQYVVMATKKGQVVKNSLELYSNPRKAGIKAVKVVDGDELVAARLVGEGQDIVLGSRKGMAIRFKEADLRPLGRYTQGVRGMTLDDEDYVVGMEACREGGTILTVCESGFGKRSPVEDYRLITRGGKGVINIRCSDRNGDVVAIKEVLDEDELIMITAEGTAIRFKVDTLRPLGRNTQGVRLHHLDEGDSIVMVERICEPDSAEGLTEADGGEGEEAEGEGEAGE
jgi:DNA gyrase subunit A